MELLTKGNSSSSYWKSFVDLLKTSVGTKRGNTDSSTIVKRSHLRLLRSKYGGLSHFTEVTCLTTTTLYIRDPYSLPNSSVPYRVVFFYWYTKTGRGRDGTRGTQINLVPISWYGSRPDGQTSQFSLKKREKRESTRRVTCGSVGSHLQYNYEQIWLKQREKRLLLHRGNRISHNGSLVHTLSCL